MNIVAFAWNPIVANEYRTRMRSWRATFAVAVCVLLLGGLGLGVAGALSGNAFLGEVNVGLIVFAALTLFQAVLLTFIVPGLTAGSITGERERQTIDLLLCSRVSPFAVLWGKLLASMSFVVLLLVMFIPVYGLFLLFGGVDVLQMAKAFLVTVVSSLTLGTVGLLFSTISRRTVAAMVATYATAFALVFGTVLLGLLMRPPASAPPVIYISPVVSLITIAADEVPPRIHRGRLNPHTDEPASSGTVEDLPFRGWSAWQVTVVFDLVICLVALGVSSQLLPPVRQAPWSRATAA